MSLKPILNRDAQRVRSLMKEIDGAFVENDRDDLYKKVTTLQSEIKSLKDNNYDVGELTDQIAPQFDKRYGPDALKSILSWETDTHARFATKQGAQSDSTDRNLGGAAIQRKVQNRFAKLFRQGKPASARKKKIDDSGPKYPFQDSRIDFDFILNHNDPAQAIREGDPEFAKALGGDTVLKSRASAVKYANAEDVDRETNEFLDFVQSAKTHSQVFQDVPADEQLRLHKIFLTGDRTSLSTQDKNWLAKEAPKAGFTGKWQFFDHLRDEARKVAAEKSKPDFDQATDPENLSATLAKALADYEATPKDQQDPKKLQDLINAALGVSTKNKTSEGSRTGNTGGPNSKPPNHGLTEDEERRLKEISPKLANTIQRFSLEQDRFDAHAERCSNEIMSLVNSGLPIEYILHMVMLRVNELQEKRIKLIASKLALSDDFEREIAKDLTKEQSEFVQNMQQRLNIRSKQEITQELKYHTDQAKNTWDTLSRVLDLLNSMSKSISEKIGR